MVYINPTQLAQPSTPRESTEFLLLVQALHVDDENGSITVDGYDNLMRYFKNVKVDPIGGTTYVPFVGQVVRVRMDKNTNPRVVSSAMQSGTYEFVDIQQGDVLIDARNRVIVLANELVVKNRSILDEMQTGGGLNYVADSGFKTSDDWESTDGSQNTVVWSETGGYLDLGCVVFDFSIPGDVVVFSQLVSWPTFTGPATFSVHLNGTNLVDDISEPFTVQLVLSERDENGDLTELDTLDCAFGNNSKEVANRVFTGDVSWVRLFLNLEIPEQTLSAGTTLVGSVKLFSEGNYKKTLSTLTPDPTVWNLSGYSPGSSALLLGAKGHVGTRDDVESGDIIDICVAAITNAEISLDDYVISMQNGIAVLKKDGVVLDGPISMNLTETFIRIANSAPFSVSFGTTEGGDELGSLSGSAAATGVCTLSTTAAMGIEVKSFKIFSAYALTVDNIQIERGTTTGSPTGWEGTPSEFVGEDVLDWINGALDGFTVDGDKVLIKGVSAEYDQWLSSYYTEDPDTHATLIHGGNIYAETLSVMSAYTGHLQVSDDGSISGGSKTSYADGLPGFFMGWTGDPVNEMQFFLGDGDSAITWDGNELNIGPGALVGGVTAMRLADSDTIGFAQDDPPTSGMKFGDVWVDTNDQRFYAYREFVLNRDPSAYWSFDESSGDFYDEVEGRVATAGAEFIRSTISALPYGGSVYGNGADTGDVSCSDAPNPSTALTLSFWYRSSNSLDQYSTICSKIGTYGWKVHTMDASSGSGRLELLITTSDGADQVELNTVVNVMDGYWHHIFFSVQAGSSASVCCVDGVQKDTGTYLIGTGFSDTADLVLLHTTTGDPPSA